jgi:hypothetical protein
MSPFRVRFHFVLFLCFALRLSAQINATGTISGQVRDPADAAIANADVKVVEQQRGVSVTARTDAGGYFTFPLLKPGIYSIEAGAPGFVMMGHKNIVLEIQQTIRQDFQLQLAGVHEQLTVTEAAPLLNTDSAELGNVISRHSMEELPVDRQNFSLLGLLVPGTNPGPVGGIRTQGNGNETQRAGAEIVADGSRGSFNSFTIDGIDDRDQSVGTIKVFPNMESIEEFKVQTGNYDAEFASGGAVVNVITRAGSNQLHGSAFEYLRNDALDARQFFDQAKPQLQQNQFGFSIGGPLRKNKTFFFGDYQGLRVHSATTSILTEPTADMRQGNFNAYPNAIYDPATYNSTTNTRTQFSGNMITPDRIDPIAKNLLAIFPLPNLPGVSNNLLIDPLQAVVQDQFDVRMDQTLSDRGTVFARYTYGRADINYPATPVLINGIINPLAFAQQPSVSGSLKLNHAPSQQATIQEVHRFTANTTNQLALGYTRFNLRVTNLDEGFNLAQQLGLQGANTGPDASAMATLTFSDESNYDSSNLPEVIPQNTWQISDTLSLTRGAHALRFGFSAIQNRFGFFQLSVSSGELDFTGIYTNNPADSSGGSGFADFLLGLPVDSAKSAFSGGAPYVRYGEYGAFVQDQWRASPRLSLTLGLRYDLFTPVSEHDNRLSDFLFPSGTLVLAGQKGVSGSILEIQKHNFSPRVGIAYRFGTNTVIRGAYGLYYFNEQGIGGSTRLFINDPFAEQYAVTCDSTDPCLHTSTGIPQTLSANNLPNAVYQPTANVTPRMQQWNLTIERHLAASLIVRAAYVGSHGSDLNININENVAVPGPGPIPPRQPYPSYGAISSWEPRGPSNYDALQFTAVKRYSRGLSFLAAYTWSKSLDEGGGGNSSTDDPRINIQDPRDVAANYGLSSFDYRQRFTLSEVYELPFGQGQEFMSGANRFLDALAGGWQATSIVTAQSGAPFSVSLATPTANTGTFTRPNRICNGNLSPDKQTIGEWFDTSCFVNPPLYTFGNTGRNILIGPGLFTWNLGLGKNFRLNERLGLQFRSEFLNLFNRPNFGFPNAKIGSSSVGTITSVVTNAREIQFTLRFHW